MQLQKLVECFLLDVCAGKVNETPKAYRTKLQHLINFLGSEREYFDQGDIDNFRVYLLSRKTIHRGGLEVKSGLSPFTIRSVLATTQHFLRWCGGHGYLPAGLEIRNIREPRPDPKAVDHETIARLIQIASTHGDPWEQARNLAIIYILVDTGGRVGSLANLEVSDLDLTRGFATARDKGDCISWLWFSPPTVDAIRAWLEIRSEREPKDYKLFTGWTGRGLAREGIYRMLKRLAEAGNIAGRCNPHAFRHAFARDFLLAGGDLGMVSDLMNHSSIVVTHKYYARWHKSELQKFHQQFGPGRDLPPVGQGSAKP